MPTYLEVVDSPRMMKGKGAPRSTIFGVLGRTTAEYSSMSKSLGGLVNKTTGREVKKGVVVPESRAKNTEHSILGAKSKTAIPGVHTGQVPYAGAYMKDVGKAL
jgi:hypothetical protein